ncbi:SNF2-related N-terminal domain [Trinorchestia longiramus]|nr:SNF2-related N-terminal domain [Trinorchestia longiramus]
MSSKADDSLRGFRKKDSESKKQSSILRFVRRDPAADGASSSSSSSSSTTSPVLGKNKPVTSNGVAARMLFIDSPAKKERPETARAPAANSPKISTIVVRKPTSVVTFRSSAASTTAQAFSAFNSSKMYSEKSTVAAANGEAHSSDEAKDKHEGGDTDDSSQDSPIMRFKMKKNRIVDSDDDDENVQRPAKKFKASNENEDKVEELLCQSFDSEPVHLIDNYLDTLGTMFPDYDKMEEEELQQRLQKRHDARAKLHSKLEQTEDLTEKFMRDKSLGTSGMNCASEGKTAKLPYVSAAAGTTMADMSTDSLQEQLERLREEEMERRKQERLLKQIDRQKMLEKRDAMIKLQKQREQERRQQEDGNGIRKTPILKRVELFNDHHNKQKPKTFEDQKFKFSNPKLLAKQKMQDKKKMFKMLGASSRFSQYENEDDEEDLYIGKSNVYVSDDDSEGEDENSGAVTAEVESMRASVLSFLNTSTEQEICAIPGCSKKKGEIIASLRPYTDWQHLVDVFKKEKYIAPDLLNNVKNALQKRNTVLQLMKRCEHISSRIHETVTSLLNGEQMDAAISQQPKLLNPEMQLKGYQMIGLNWLSLMLQFELNGVLADEMGLGKTVQAIAFLAHVRETVQPEDLSLIVVPSSTLDNWARELELWCPSLGVLMYHGSQEERRGMRMQILQNQLDENTHVILTTYNTMYSCAEDRALFKRLKIHTVIFDEAHMLKNMNTARFENLMRISAECRILLTGTPLQNNLVELMSILVFVMPQLFEGRKEELKQVFAMFPKADDRDKSQYEAKRIEQAKRIMKPFFLRRLKSDVLKDLPTKHDRIETIEMAEGQQKLYSSVVEVLSKKAKQMKDQLENVQAEKLTELEELQLNQESLGMSGKKKKTEGSTSAESTSENSSANMLMTLRRIANHPLLYRRHYNDDKIREMARILKRTSHSESVLEYIIEDFSVMSDYDINKTCKIYPAIRKYKLDDSAILASGKFQKFDELLPDMKERGDRVLIFSQFVIVLDIVEEYMRQRGYRFLRLDGQTPVTERQEMIDEFNEDQEIFVFLLSTRAGGLGINLTSANVVILHDIDFNPYNDKQAEDRCHRVGQTRPVTVIRFVTKDSIEEGILSCAQSKLDLEREVTGTKDEQHKKVDVLSLLKAALGIQKND